MTSEEERAALVRVAHDLIAQVFDPFIQRAREEETRMHLTERDLLDGYRNLARSNVPDRVARAHMTEQVILDRIGQLVKYRKWYRRQTALWADLAKENDTELRALLKVARKARALSAAPLAFDAEGTLLGEAWTEPELREAFGG